MHITEGNGLPAAGGTEADEEVGNLSPVEKLKEVRSEERKKERKPPQSGVTSGNWTDTLRNPCKGREKVGEVERRPMERN